MRRYFFYLFLILLLYFPALKLGFAQDDFFFLKISSANSLKEVFNFFNPLTQGSFPFYRPLGTQLYFYLFRSASLMHIFMLMVHALSVVQVFKLFVNLGIDKRKSNLAALIYLFASLHFLSLVYIAASQHLFATAFSLLSLNAFFAASPSMAALYFFLALLSKESAIILPLIVGIFYLYKNHKLGDLKNLITRFSPYLIVLLSYGLVRFLAGVTVQSEYAYIIDSRILLTLRFYLLYLFGYMESVQDYGFPRGVLQYLLDTKPWGYLTLVGSVLSFLTIFICFIRQQITLKNVVYGSLIFFFGLTLYLGLPTHIFPHYLDYSLLGFLVLFVGIQNKNVLKVVTLLMIIGSIGGIYSSFRLHWSPTRSRLNAKYLPFLIAQGLCDTPYVVLLGDALTIRNLYYSLSGSNAASFICGKEMDLSYLSPTDLAGEDKRYIVPQGAKIIKVEPL